MAERLFLVPTQGTIQRDHRTRKVLAEAGEWVDVDITWRRRLRDGDVKVGTPTVEATVPPIDTPPVSGTMVTETTPTATPARKGKEGSK